MNKEPILKILIIPIEYKYTKITFNISNEKSYRLKSDSSFYNVKVGSNKVELSESGWIFSEFCINSKELIIEPQENISLLSNNLLILEDVPVGRGFHWEKKIHFSLPGSLRLIKEQNFIIVVNEVLIEDYVSCVVSSEMSSTCPLNFIKAQMTAARSWLLCGKEKKHYPFDACCDDCCQRYHGAKNINEKVIEAKKSTYGQVLKFDGNICDARYSKCCGGITENSEEVWGISYPYLISKNDSKKELKSLDTSKEENFKKWLLSSPNVFCNTNNIDKKKLIEFLGGVDEDGNYFRWEIKYSIEELKNILSKKFDDIDSILEINTINRSKSGRVTKLKIKVLLKNKKEKDIIIHKEYNIRKILHESFLYSASFIIENNFNTENKLESVLIKGAGWGHGAGLCQFGALKMAIEDFNFDEILYHYFPNTNLEKIY